MKHRPPYTVRNLNRQAPDDHRGFEKCGERGECWSNVPDYDRACEFAAAVHEVENGDPIVVEDADGSEVLRLPKPLIH
jgi:hypothetical protein